MSIELAPSQGSSPRVSVGASMLIAVLLSLPMAGEARAAMTPTSSARWLSVAPDQVLPAEIIRRLCAGIRYESEASPVRHEPGSLGSPVGPVSARGHAEPQFETLVSSLIDLPPPATCR